MKAQQPVFLDQANRELFSSQVVAGKKLRIAKYKNFFKNKEVVKVLESEVFNQTVDAFLLAGATKKIFRGVFV